MLTTKVDGNENNTIFWGNARVVLRDGSERYLADLPTSLDNLVVPSEQGKDYYDGPVKIAGDLMKFSTPGMPAAPDEVGTVTVDLSELADLDVVSFKARIGGDFPLGDESHRLKTMAVRTHGKEARFLAVIEPYESKAVVKSVTASGPNQLTVELNDGRVQEITLSGLDAETNDQLKIVVRELRDGEVVREEATE